MPQAKGHTQVVAVPEWADARPWPEKRGMNGDASAHRGVFLMIRRHPFEGPQHRLSSEGARCQSSVEGV